MGPSTVNLEDISPIPPVTPKRLLLPLFVFTLSTEDKRPPYFAGIPALINSTSFIASTLNTEKNPNK